MHRDASDLSPSLTENVMTFYLKMPNHLSNSRRPNPLAQQSITYSSCVNTATAFSSYNYGDLISHLSLVNSSSFSLAANLARIQTKNHSRRKLPQLMPHHILRNRHIVVYLPIMHLKLEPDEIWQDGGAARLRFDRDCTLARFGGNDWEARCGDGSEIRAASFWRTDWFGGM